MPHWVPGGYVIGKYIYDNKEIKEIIRNKVDKLNQRPSDQNNVEEHLIDRKLIDSVINESRENPDFTG